MFTTLNVYSHSTEEMQRAAADRIDQTIGAVTGVQASCESEKEERANTRAETKRAVFEPYKGKKRKPGTGYIKQLSPNCWQGRYTPTVNGKRMSQNVYATTVSECEEKLAELIRQMKQKK